MRLVKSDVVAFNLHVRTLLDSLQARGENTYDLLVKLFKGYRAATNPAFVAYINRKQELYNDGEEITPERLMHDAKNKFASLRDEGKWCSLSRGDTKLVALRAETKRLKDELARYKNKERATVQALSATSHNNNNKKHRKDKGGSNNNANKGNSNNQWQPHQAPAWTKIPPAPNEPHQKTVNSRLYHWCPKHRAWTRHHPSECCLGQGSSMDLITTAPGPVQGDSCYTLCLANALTNISGL
jgi:hypothetical protein